MVHRMMSGSNVKENDMDAVACLRALHAVRLHGTVTAAAAVVRLSPSALSQQVKRLERATGQALTAASGRRIVLTPAAHALLDHALPLAEQLSRALTTNGAPPGEGSRGQVAGHVRVAAFATAVADHVLETLAHLGARQPGLTWSLLEIDPDRALPALGAGAVDLAVVHHWKGQPAQVHPGLTLAGAHHDPAEIICRRDDPLAGAVADAEQLAARRWVSTGAGSVCHAWLVHMFAHHGQRADIVAEIADFALHLDFVRHGLGLALLPRMGRPQLPEELTTLAFDQAPSRVVNVATRTNQNNDPAIAALRDALLAAVA